MNDGRDVLSNNRKKILRPDEVSGLVSALRQSFPDSALEYIESLGIDIEAQARFLSVARACQKTREAQGYTVKAASDKIKVPQYRLKAIESSMISQIRKRDLENYIEFLALTEWFADWQSKNSGIVERLHP